MEISRYLIPVISSTGGVRDPHILRCEDGKTFYMVVTDMVSGNGWSSNRAMILLKSKDLVHWTSNIVNIQKKYPNQEDLKRVWAPQTIYDREAGKYMTLFTKINSIICSTKRKGMEMELKRPLPPL